MASIQTMLRPQVLTRVVNRIVGEWDAILNFMGAQPGGFNERSFGHGRVGNYHVYNRTRKIGVGRAPGTAAARSDPQGFTNVPFVYPRMHDSVSLLAEYYHNLSQIADPRMRDQAGADMIRRQTTTLGQKGANWRTAMVVGMLKDSLYTHQDGDDWYWNYTSSGNLQQVSFGMPAGNKNQLNMTDRAGNSIYSGNVIDTSWANSGADIPLHIQRIDAARREQGVGPLRHVHLTSLQWQNVINNDAVVSQAGIATTPFQVFEREFGRNPDGTVKSEKIGRLASCPGVDWHISDEGLELGAPGSETFQKHWEDTACVFMGDPQLPDAFTLMLGSEPIAEYDGGAETVRTGMSSWSVKTSNPTATQLFILDNALIVNHDPYSVAYGTVEF